MIKPVIAVGKDAVLGEGPLWAEGPGKLFWLDIVGKMLYEYDPVSGTNLEYSLPHMAGTVALRKRGGLVLALEEGIHFHDPETGKMEKIADPEKNFPETRYNDGKCDPAGRFWVGTMGREGEPGLGSLYRLDADHGIISVMSGIDISNGMAWSPDREKMYWTDTLKGEIYSFDYDNESGEIRNKRTSIKVEAADGLPDGMTMDTEGMLWVACWGGGKVVRYDPAEGRKIKKITLPASLVTSCTFGGGDMKSLFITTARMGLSEEETDRQPAAGSLFVCTPGSTGVPSTPYEG
jgi:sugar lactone lactonase YvrE